MGFRGAIFDVDGVLVDSPHEQAWREALQQLMENEWSDIRPQTSYAPEKFTPEVYQRVMSGKPRYAGAQAVLEVEDEEDLRRTVEGQDVEEFQPVLLAREYIAISRARRELEESKARFVDDPSGALEDARQAVGRALETRGYPSLERANEASGSRQEVLREYQATDPEGSGSLEDTRGAFNRLSDLLDRIART